MGHAAAVPNGGAIVTVGPGLLRNLSFCSGFMEIKLYSPCFLCLNSIAKNMQGARPSRASASRPGLGLCTPLLHISDVRFTVLQSPAVGRQIRISQIWGGAMDFAARVTCCCSTQVPAGVAPPLAVTVPAAGQASPTSPCRQAGGESCHGPASAGFPCPRLPRYLGPFRKSFIY